GRAFPKARADQTLLLETLERDVNGRPGYLTSALCADLVEDGNAVGVRPEAQDRQQYQVLDVAQVDARHERSLLQPSGAPSTSKPTNSCVSKLLCGYQRLCRPCGTMSGTRSEPSRKVPRTLR